MYCSISAAIVVDMDDIAAIKANAPRSVECARLSFFLPPLLNEVSQVSTVRVYGCSPEGYLRYHHLYVLRHHVVGHVDIPLLPWSIHSSYSNVMTRVTSLTDTRNITSPLVFRTFAFRHNSTPLPTDAFGTVVPGVHWDGSIIVLRCSQADPNRIVNMRTGDDRHAVQVLLRYAINHPLRSHTT